MKTPFSFADVSVETLEPRLEFVQEGCGCGCEFSEVITYTSDPLTGFELQDDHSGHARLPGHL